MENRERSDRYHRNVFKTIFELEEDGVTPLRARIVERLGHSGPTVSQTIGRMERDGLVHVMGGQAAGTDGSGA